MPRGDNAVAWQYALLYGLREGFSPKSVHLVSAFLEQFEKATRSRSDLGADPSKDEERVAYRRQIAGNRRRQGGASKGARVTDAGRDEQAIRARGRNGRLTCREKVSAHQAGRYVGRQVGRRCKCEDGCARHGLAKQASAPW
jgi:hypothetical protein